MTTVERPLDRVAASPYFTALAAWVTARVLLAVAWAASSMPWFDRLETATSVRHQGLFLWDGTYYRDLAQHGYDGVATGVQRFFPLFPLLGRWVGWLLGGNDDLGLLVVSNLAALAALRMDAALAGGVPPTKSVETLDADERARLARNDARIDTEREMQQDASRAAADRENTPNTPDGQTG